MGKQGRVRLRNAKSGNRWRKGQSGLSNPQTIRHRNAARGKFGDHLAQAVVRREDSTAAGLTQDLLATHDAVIQEEEEGNTVVATGTLSLANSSAYSLIETANPVFGQVKRLWNSPLESHKEILAVLAAVSEVIKVKNGEDSVTEYFAALLTALEAADDEKSITAVVYLLSIVMEKVSVSVLQAQFGSVSKILTSRLSQFETSDSTSLLKSLVSCLVTLLAAQPHSLWSDSYLQTILQSLMNFTVHPKPRLRKCAQSGLAGMLREGGEQGDDVKFHPSCSVIVKICKIALDRGGVETSTLHTLGLLKDCLANFPTQHIKSLCESLLKFITLGKSIVKTTGFQCLNGLFTSNVGPQGLSAQLNGQLISALYDHQPSNVDAQLMLAWCTVMEGAHLRLLSLDYKLCFGHLPKFFLVCIQSLSDNRTVSKLVADVMKNILKTSVPLALSVIEEKTKTKTKQKNKESMEYSILHSMFKCVENALGYKYQSVWDHVLGVLETFYALAGGRTQCYKFMLKSLKSLNELRNVPKFSYVSELEAAFGAAVTAMGPRIVLTAVPLKLDVMSDPPDFPQSWILPVLQEYVQCSELSYFIDELLPMAGVMRSLAEDCKRNKRKALEGKLYSTLEYQIWCLLTAFCNKPTDVSSAFPVIAKVLGTALTEKIDVRNVICLSLKLLIESCKENESDCKELSRFAKNYLPILFNLYTNDPFDGEPSREPILDSIKAYLSITDPKLLQALFSRILSKLRETDSSANVRIALEDITEGFVPFLTQTALTDLYNVISPLLDSANSTTQKKGYKLLAAILSCDSTEHKSFVSINLPQLQSLLLGSLSTAGIGSKKPRLRCLIQLIPHLTTDHHDFLLAVIPEAILCTKEANEKCRHLSYKLLSLLGKSSQQLFMLSPEESMREYFDIVLAGLAGSSHTVSATIGSLARLVYEFNDLLGAELVEKLLSSVTVFLSARAREVVRSALVFIKVTIGVLPHSELAPHVKELVEKVLKWGENDRNHFRLKSRVILERLIRKFNLEMIASFVPSKQRRLISHIRKTTERQKRKKRERREEKMSAREDHDDFLANGNPKVSKPSFEELLYDSSSDDEQEEKNGKRKSGRVKKQAQGTWIREENDKPLDLLDPSASRNVLGTDPHQKVLSSSKEIFSLSNDGKLVISEQDTTEGDELKRSSRKRGREESSDVDENDTTAGLCDFGTGIRRKDPLKMAASVPGSQYRAKKAKGDVKKKGQPDPYAYVQLNRQQLNKRKRAKLSGQFKGLLHKAQKGSTLGRKQREKQRKRTS